MQNNKLTLSLMPQTVGICKLDPNASIPQWATQSPFFSITKTFEELSMVVLEDNIPLEIKAEKDWRMLKVEGQLDFALTGILASLLTPLAEAKISIFAISTFDTDYILVKKDKLAESISILNQFCIII